MVHNNELLLDTSWSTFKCKGCGLNNMHIERIEVIAGDDNYDLHEKLTITQNENSSLYVLSEKISGKSRWRLRNEPMVKIYMHCEHASCQEQIVTLAHHKGFVYIEQESGATFVKNSNVTIKPEININVSGEHCGDCKFLDLFYCKLFENSRLEIKEKNTLRCKKCLESED